MAVVVHEEVEGGETLEKGGKGKGVSLRWKKMKKNNNIYIDFRLIPPPHQSQIDTLQSFLHHSTFPSHTKIDIFSHKGKQQAICVAVCPYFVGTLGLAPARRSN